MNSEPLESAKKLFFILLGVDVVVTAVVGLNAFSTVGALRAIQSGTLGVDQSLLSSLKFWGWFSMLMILTMIGVGLGLWKWLNSCYRFAKGSLGATGFKNERWTAAGWIIPIFNLFKPYQIINEIYKAGAPGYTASEDWKKESGSGLLLAWWIFWAVTHFIGTIISKQILRGSMPEDGSLQHAIFTTELQVWACIISLVIAGLWFWVANMLTQRLLDRAAMTVVNATAGQFANVTENTSSHTPISTSPTLSQESASAVNIAPVASGQPEAQRQSDSIPQATSANSNDIYLFIANELESNTTDKALWTRLFAECDGDENRTKAAYIRQRANQLQVINGLTALQGSSEPSFNVSPGETALPGDSETPNAQANLHSSANHAKILIVVVTLIVAGALLYWAIVTQPSGREPGSAKGLSDSERNDFLYGSQSGREPGSAKGGDPFDDAISQMESQSGRESGSAKVVPVEPPLPAVTGNCYDVEGALKAGVTKIKIIAYLAKKINFPETGISVARKRGYSDDEIIGKLCEETATTQSPQKKELKPWEMDWAKPSAGHKTEQGKEPNYFDQFDSPRPKSGNSSPSQ